MCQYATRMHAHRDTQTQTQTHRHTDTQTHTCVRESILLCLVQLMYTYLSVPACHEAQSKEKNMHPNGWGLRHDKQGTAHIHTCKM